MESLSCAICTRKYNCITVIPYVIACGHTFCKQCIEGFKNKCPLDRKDFKIENIIENLTIKSFISELKSFYVQEIEPTIPKDPSKPNSCLAHNRFYEFYCITCSKLSCDLCISECGHIGPDYIIAKDEFQSQVLLQYEDLRKLKHMEASQYADLDILKGQWKKKLEEIEEKMDLSIHDAKEAIQLYTKEYLLPDEFNIDDLHQCAQIIKLGKKFEEQYKSFVEESRFNIKYDIENIEFKNMMTVERYAKEVKILLIGIEATGKTMILYRQKCDERVNTVPTIGFNCENIELPGYKLVVWDIGGQPKIRMLWRHYYNGTQGIMYVIDPLENNYNVDKALIKEMIDDDSLNDVPFLFMINKSDLVNESLDQMSNKLELSTLMANREWNIISTSAETGEGLQESFEWIAQASKKN